MKLYDPRGLLKNWRPTRNWKVLTPLTLKHWEVLGNLMQQERSAGSSCPARQGTRKVERPRTGPHKRVVKKEADVETKPKKRKRSTGVRRSPLKELLADFEHQRWANWQEHLHSKCTLHKITGDLTIPHNLVIKFRGRIHRKYNKLPEEEKTSDRDMAERLLAHLRYHGYKIVERDDEAG